MAGMLLLHKFERDGKKYTKRCDFCHGAKNSLYSVRFEEDGEHYWLCPGRCLSHAQHNFAEKKGNGIHPVVPTESTDWDNEITAQSNNDNIDR